MDLSGGIQACDELLARRVKGRIRAAALRQKAMFLLLSGERGIGEAIASLREALPLTAAHPADRAHVLHLLVTAYSFYGSFDLARPCADAYSQLAADNSDMDVRKWAPKVWFNLGYCYNTARKYPESADAYLKAIETAGDDPEWFNPGLAEHNLVEVYLELGQIDSALHMLGRAEQHLSPDAWFARIKEQEAECFHALGQHDAVRLACAEAFRHPSCGDDVWAEALFVLARTEAAQGHRGKASQLAERSLDLAIQIPLSRLVRRLQEFQAFLDSRKEVL